MGKQYDDAGKTAKKIKNDIVESVRTFFACASGCPKFGVFCGGSQAGHAPRLLFDRGCGAAGAAVSALLYFAHPIEKKA
jgi:hypothetical protein